jgi:hypothetical protein
MSAMGSSVIPPAVGAGFPAWAFRYEYPDPGPRFHTPTCIVRCPRCGATSYPAHERVEPIDDPEELC